MFQNEQVQILKIQHIKEFILGFLEWYILSLKKLTFYNLLQVLFNHIKDKITEEIQSKNIKEETKYSERQNITRKRTINNNIGILYQNIS